MLHDLLFIPLPAQARCDEFALWIHKDFIGKKTTPYENLIIEIAPIRQGELCQTGVSCKTKLQVDDRSFPQTNTGTPDAGSPY